MTSYPHISREDRSVESEGDDRLDRGPFVGSLIRALVVDELGDDNAVTGRRATGYVVGLTGQWGPGKSTVLNLVAGKHKSTKGVVVAVFNPWLFKGRDELVKGFFNALRDALGCSRWAMVSAAVQLWAVAMVLAYGPVVIWWWWVR